MIHAPLSLAALATVSVLAAQEPSKDRGILVHAEEGFRVVRASDGEVAPVLDGVGGHLSHATRAPDGAAVAVVCYSGGRRQVWLHEHGKEPVAIGPDHGRDQIVDLAWSFDGAWLAYQVDGHTVGEGGVYVLSRDGETARRVTPDGAHDGALDWAPDGLSLAVAATTKSAVERHADMIWVERESAVDVVDVATWKRERVASLDFAIGELAWSPDGVELAFLSGDGALYRVALADRAVVPLARGLSNHGRPRWAPDGQRLLVHRARGSGPAAPGKGRPAPDFRLLVLDRDGAPVFEHETKSQIWYYDWAPDGRRIAFTTARRRLEVVDVATGAVEALCPVGFWSHVAWGADR